MEEDRNKIIEQLMEEELERLNKDNKYDAFTEIINSIDTLANDSGYFKLIHYVNPTEYKIVKR